MTKKDDKRKAAAERVNEVMAATTAAIVEAIERGLADPAQWRAPWHEVRGDAMNPTNPTTGKSYTGGNRLALAIYSMQTGAPSHWATFKQWQTIGAQVRKGERASYIIRPATAMRDNPQTGERESFIFGWSAHAVFHAGQVDGYEMPAPIELDAHDVDTAADIADAYEWARVIGATVRSDRPGAFYSPTLDYVNVPPAEAWHDAHGAWSTIAHELTHWTGHPDRLARTFGKKFGDMDYAAEELCAELGAAFSLAARGRTSEPREDHARYLAHWLTVLKSSPDALWNVAARAEKAATYLAERAARFDLAA